MTNCAIWFKGALAAGIAVARTNGAITGFHRGGHGPAAFLILQAGLRTDVGHRRGERADVGNYRRRGIFEAVAVA